MGPFLHVINFTENFLPLVDPPTAVRSEIFGQPYKPYMQKSKRVCGLVLYCKK